MMTPTLKTLQDSLARPVPGHSVAVMRIVMGVLMLFESVNYGLFHCLECIYHGSEMLFKYQYFDWVPVPSARGIQGILLVLGVASIGVIFGFWYRLSILVATFCVAWYFLLDASLYLNHYYLTLIFLGILCFIPANRVWAMDAKRYADTSPYIRNWSRLWLIVQLEIVLIYAGVVKLNPDWLQLEPLRLWMTGHVNNTSAFTQWLTQDAGIALAAYGVIVLHILGAPLLLWSKTRLAVFFLYAIFHTINAIVFNIGIFPFMTIAATTLVFAPDWPVRLWAKFKGLPLPEFGAGDALIRSTSFFNAKGVAISLFVCLWLVVQTLLPTRPLWHEGPVIWNEAGHMFSWRMKLRDKRGKISFLVRNEKANSVKLVDPRDYLNRRQVGRMACQPDLIWQFAKFLEADVIESRNGQYTVDDIVVFGNSTCSVNTRPSMPLLKRVDLTALDRDAPRSEWVTELTAKLPSR